MVLKVRCKFLTFLKSAVDLYITGIRNLIMYLLFTMVLFIKVSMYFNILNTDYGFVSDIFLFVVIFFKTIIYFLSSLP